MKYVIKDAISGKMLESYDPDFRPNPSHVTGLAKWTDDPAKAMTFISPGAALTLWKTQSTVCPLRPDGKPNRPLTAYSVSVELLQ